MLEWKITYREAFQAFIAANIMFALVFGLNQVIDSNYIMTTRLPAHIMKLFPFLSYINIPILWLELAGVAACFIAFIPLFFYTAPKKESKILLSYIKYHKDRILDKALLILIACIE